MRNVILINTQKWESIPQSSFSECIVSQIGLYSSNYFFLKNTCTTMICFSQKWIIWCPLFSTLLLHLAADPGRLSKPMHFSLLHSLLILLLSIPAVANSWIIVGGAESEDPAFLSLEPKGLSFIFVVIATLTCHSGPCRCFLWSPLSQSPFCLFYFLRVLTLYSRFVSNGATIPAVVMTPEVMS